MGYRQTKAARRSLLEVANDQGGYFTAKQAQEAGYGYTHLDYHRRAGNFERIGHGIYRLATHAVVPHDDLIRLSLWSRDRKDEPQAVVSHATALALHELSGIIPSKIHLTVPLRFRKRAPRGVVLHRFRLPTGSTEAREGFQLTTPLQTLVDVDGDATVPDDQLHEALCDALDRGLIRRSAMKAELKRIPTQRLGKYFVRTK